MTTMDNGMRHKKVALSEAQRAARTERILEGDSFADIARVEGVKRQAILTYAQVNAVDHYDQRMLLYHAWQEARGRRLEGEAELRETMEEDLENERRESEVSAISGFPRKSRWAARTALKYIGLTRGVAGANSNYEFGELFTIYDRYRNAKREGKQPSLKQLGAGTGIYPSGVREILTKVGLRSLRHSCKFPLKDHEKYISTLFS